MSKLRWKVYRDGQMIASCRDVEDAAAIVGMANAGEIRDAGTVGRRVVYRHGDEGTDPANSVDEVAQLILKRVDALHEAYRKACIPTRLGDQFGR